MTPTKRQIAKVLRQAARNVPQYPRLTAALFDVCKGRGNRASAYYDNAVRALKAYCPSFRALLQSDVPDVQMTLRKTARAIEHGLWFDSVSRR